MAGRATRIVDLPIWVKLVVTLWLLIVLTWGAALGWAYRAHRESTLAQAREFAVSVHQLTLAGLTAMMIAGSADKRGIFLDQIEHSNNIRALKALRSDAVVRQFGLGTVSELPADPLEISAISQGTPMYEIRREGGVEFLKAAIPAIASRDYLGKDCLGCHAVSEGTVLGAVSMEISLERVNRAVADYGQRVAFSAFALSLPLMLLIYLAVSRLVTRPLRELARGLGEIAEGHVDLAHRLPVRGQDEVSMASAAFNRVMDKARALFETERLAGEVFSHSLEAITICDRNGNILRVNEAFTRTTGYSAEEVVGRNPRILKSGRQGPDFYKTFWEALSTRGEWQGEIWNRRKNGEVYAEWLNVSAVRDARGEAEYYIALFSDITERKLQEERMHHQAYHDGLTGLPNRELFRDRLEQVLAGAKRHRDQLGAVMFLDLDRFKEVNDTLGHEVGDQLLVQTAQRLRASVRAADTVARMGGDEFTVLLSEVSDGGDVEVVAAKILGVMRKPFALAGRELQVTVSIGASLYPLHGRDPAALMKCADLAMYRVKARGRAGFSLYDATMGPGDGDG
ncbi:MAG TPA: diguanylate cyclase [Burkholderiales bacterium]|nr:diguanylate cyclase [Burkholderiales bacterium]